MKLCDITQFYSPVSGGVKRYVSEKQKFINAAGEHEHLLIIPGDSTARKQMGRCTVWTVKSPRVDRTSRYRILLNVPAAMEIMRVERPDIIESGDPYHLAWATLDQASVMNIPAVAFYHSHFPDAYLRTVGKYCGRAAHDLVQDIAQDYIHRLYNSFACTLVPSPHLAEILAGWGVRTAVPVRLGVDTEIFRPGPRIESVRAQFGAKPDQIMLLSVGRLANEKNTRTLLGAFEILCRRAPGRYHLLVVGDGPLRPDVLKAQEATGAVEWRRYFHDSRELADLYRSCDLFVHPGVCETFGLVTVEAQACGTPVVGIHGSFMDRLAFAGLDKWAAANTPAALADAVEAMAASDIPALGAQASERVLADYSWERVFRHHFEIFSGAIARFRK